MKNLIIAFTILTTCVGNPIFSQHEEKFIDKKNELSFEENKGQMKDQFWKARPDVLFYGHSEGMNFFIKNSGMSYQLSRVESWKDKDELMKELHANTSLSKEKIPNEIGTYRVDVNWLGANHNFETQKGQELDGYNNYYNVPEGVEPALFVKKYASITLNNVWDGINLHYYGTDGLLETDYLVSPGADFKQIKIQYEGAELSTDNHGNLIIKTPFGEIQEGSLKVFQEGKQIEAHWMIQEGNIVSFDIPTYNPNLAMVIDPLTRVWGTYYGGEGDDNFFDCKALISGTLYCIGNTNSLNSISSGGFQNTFGGGINDVIMVKFNSNGIRIWSSYLGGSNDDVGRSIHLQTNGEILIIGDTKSTNNVAYNGFQNTFGGGLGDAFLAKFNSNGIRIWSSYYGGNGSDVGRNIKSGVNGDIFICGFTTSSNNISDNGYQNSYGGQSDAFIAKFNYNGLRIWATYFGGSAVDAGISLTLDQNNYLYLAGHSESQTNVAFSGFQTTYNGGNRDAFLVKFDINGNLIWSTYYGGTGYDIGLNSNCDNNGNIYLIGYTDSQSSIALNGSQNNFGGGLYDGFIVKFSPSCQRLWASYFGGNNYDVILSSAIDNYGNLYVAGMTNSTNNIAFNGHQNNFGGGIYDAFMAQLNSFGTKNYGTYYGGFGDENGNTVATNSNGSIYLAGSTTSIDTISHLGFQNTIGGQSDAYIVKFNNLKPNASNLGYYGFSLLKWDLSPNPTSSEITITSDQFTNEPYTLYDQMGRTVGSGILEGTSTTISLSTLSKGIYILKVEGAYESAIVVKE